ncbi:MULTISPECIES: carbohydrate ABC transporter permease [unclassified Paenibacillus]|uniref:carbohydrate ABC transporter permease n=1 Tax=unclassified Paenibacillus TaxID=185978 RepID=UPI000700B2BA|nr:carbohydrate ABC transporter permease [Paenibacillus sp. Soil750]KRE57925.1 ABC transporter permease [Paenibacillus sp. Soil750]
MSFIIHKTKKDKVIDACIYTVLTVAALVTLFPLYYVIIVSLTPYIEVLKNGGFVIWPEHWTLQAYKEVFQSARIPQALKITVFITIVGTTLNLVVTTLLAYPLAKKSVPGRNFILMAIFFTMIFSGGIIPLYMVVRSIGLYDSVWALIVPGMVSTFNLLIVKTYFENLPVEVEEAARVDGCGELATLWRIVLPLSAPIMATIGLFYGVTHWNEYFKGIFYISDKTLMPMQVVLRSMIQTPNISTELSLNSLVLDALPPETIKMAVVVVATLPMLVIYPFLQKYFVKGTMLGSIKG